MIQMGEAELWQKTQILISVIQTVGIFANSLLSIHQMKQLNEIQQAEIFGILLCVLYMFDQQGTGLTQ